MVVALGTFDGVHAGHRALIERAVEIAAQRGERALIYTYANHPLSAFGASPKLLQSNEERLSCLSQFGAEVVAETFTMAYAMQTPAQFAAFLKQRFDVRVAVAGFNYSFGKNRSGNIKTLDRLGAELGFEVVEIPPVHYLGIPVSSSRIRCALEKGEVGAAAAMLGRYYRLGGRILHNRRIGRTIGFPTANIACPEGRVIPQDGVYVTRATLGGKAYGAVTNIGANPTVNGAFTTIETHLIGFGEEAYGQELDVEFVHRLRACEKFESLDALKAQIARDVQRAKALLGEG